MPYRLDIPGWMTAESLRAIEELARSVPERGLVIEVGAFLGCSTWAWCKSVHPTVSVVAIDRFDWLPDYGVYGMTGAPYDKSIGVEALFRENVADCHNLSIYRGDSLTFRPPKRANLVFIDANHTMPSVALDIGYYYSFVANGGVICGDDYNLAKPDHPDVIRSVDQFAASINREVHNIGGRLWAITV